MCSKYVVVDLKTIKTIKPTKTNCTYFLHSKTRCWFTGGCQSIRSYSGFGIASRGLARPCNRPAPTTGAHSTTYAPCRNSPTSRKLRSEIQSHNSTSALHSAIANSTIRQAIAAIGKPVLVHLRLSSYANFSTWQASASWR